MTEAPPPPVLQMQHIAKTFGTVRALSDVSFAAHAGEVHALMGENGAGKSTLMKILSGAYHPDPGGEIRLAGKPVHIDGPAAARHAGIATIYQELALSPNLTVAENVFLGREMRRAGLIDRTAMAKACQPVLDRLAVPFSPGTRVAALSLAERQIVEIARALLARSRILVMDEPTTSLSSRETDRLFDLIRQLRAEGLAIIYISHRMAEIHELADRVSVLRDGRYIGTLTRAEMTEDALLRMMVGRDISGFYKKEHKPPEATRRVVLSVQDIADGKRVHGCSFEVHEGEVLGIAGLVGAGRTELARLVCGADRRIRGRIVLEGKEIAARTPGEVIDAGMVYLTEDRKLLGLFLDMSVRENIVTGVIGRDAHAGILDRAAARRRSAKAVAALSIRARSDAVVVGSLSGGNQQKALLARLLETKPRVVFLDEPTRGIDVGAKSEIYRLIDQLARAGMAIVVISSELPEIIGICDRALVMRDGAFAGELHATAEAPLSQEAVIAIATGAARRAA